MMRKMSKEDFMFFIRSGLNFESYNKRSRDEQILNKYKEKGRRNVRGDGLPQETMLFFRKNN